MNHSIVARHVATARKSRMLRRWKTDLLRRRRTAMPLLSPLLLLSSATSLNTAQ